MLRLRIGRGGMCIVRLDLVIDIKSAVIRLH